MDTPLIPFALPSCTVDRVYELPTTLVIEAHTVAPTAVCSTCQTPATRIHSRSTRIVHDLPVSDRRVLLRLRVRRFFCDQPTCGARTFTEQIPVLMPLRGQRTVRLTHRLQALASHAGGEGGARLAAAFQLRTSAATLLRILRRSTIPAVGTPLVLGVDDFALQKGRTYGTILVDLERHQPIDVLPNRQASTLATWLQDHPGVAIIARDRSTEYAAGATLGAPAALQVADRWHLLKNHRDALERLLTRLAPEYRALVPRKAAASRATIRIRSGAEQAASHLARQRRYERYEQAQALAQTGMSIQQIATQLTMHRATVRKYVRTTTFPEHARHPVQASKLDPYEAYLMRQWGAGVRNASQLYRELQVQGYAGHYRQVARWMSYQRRNQQGHAPGSAGPTNASATTGRALVASPSQLAWLLVRRPAQLLVTETALLQHALQHSVIAEAYQLAQRFQRLVRQRTVAELDRWLDESGASSVAELRTFANGLRQEYASIAAAIREPWSSGQVEGQITRLKYLKRQMYGRANFDLLRIRVLSR